MSHVTYFDSNVFWGGITLFIVAISALKYDYVLILSQYMTIKNCINSLLYYKDLLKISYNKINLLIN